jgi:hypothetical protein
MIYFNKKIFIIKKEPIFIFKIEDLFDLDFYLDIKKVFYKIDPEKLSLTNNFGKKSISSLELSYEDENKSKILERLNQVFLSKDFFNFFVKKIYLKNVKTQKNILRKIKYLRFPILNNKKKSILDFLFSKISVKYTFSYIKNNGGIVPHVDSQRKYLSLMLYFPDDEEKEIDYGTTFWESNIPNFTNTHIKDKEQIEDFKTKSKQLYKTKFISNCLYGFLRNDFSWHTVEPVNIDTNYIRKSLNINFLYDN